MPLNNLSVGESQNVLSPESWQAKDESNLIKSKSKSSCLLCTQQRIRKFLRVLFIESVRISDDAVTRASVCLEPCSIDDSDDSAGIRDEAEILEFDRGECNRRAAGSEHDRDEFLR